MTHATSTHAGEERVTATYYEILGVSADRDHDAIKQAFVDGAMRFRASDQRLGDRAEDARRAFRLAEINDAWATLRNPAARADYDNHLRDLQEAAAHAAAAGPRTHASAVFDSSDRSATDGPTSPVSISAISSGSRAATTNARPATSSRPTRTLFVPAEPSEVLILEPDDAEDRTTSARRRHQWLPMGFTMITAVLAAMAFGVSGAHGTHGATASMSLIRSDQGLPYDAASCWHIPTATPVDGSDSAAPSADLTSVSCDQADAAHLVARVAGTQGCPKHTVQLTATHNARVFSLCLRPVAAPPDLPAN